MPRNISLVTLYRYDKDIARRAAVYDTNREGKSETVLDKSELKALRQNDYELYQEVVKIGNIPQKYEFLYGTRFAGLSAHTVFYNGAAMAMLMGQSKAWGTPVTIGRQFGYNTGLRLGFSGSFAGKEDKTLAAVSADFALGKHTGTGWNYMGWASFTYLEHKKEMQPADEFRITTLGGELDKQIMLNGKSLLQLGVTAGLGFVNGVMETAAGAQGNHTRVRMAPHSTLAMGVLFDMRLGEEGGLGTVKFDGSFQAFGMTARRVESTVMVYVADSLLIGGGARWFEVTHPDLNANEKFSLFMPFFGVIWGGGSY